MNGQELQDLRRLLGKLRTDMELDDGTVYCGVEIKAIDNLATVQLESILSTTAGDGGFTDGPPC